MNQAYGQNESEKGNLSIIKTLYEKLGTFRFSITGPESIVLLSKIFLQVQNLGLRLLWSSCFSYWKLWVWKSRSVDLKKTSGVFGFELSGFLRQQRNQLFLVVESCSSSSKPSIENCME